MNDDYLLMVTFISALIVYTPYLASTNYDLLLVIAFGEALFVHNLSG